MKTVCYCSKLMLQFSADNPPGVLARGTEMKEITTKLTKTFMGLVLLLALAFVGFPNGVSAQMQPWLQQEQARQMAERQQWMMWQRQEQVRQSYERAQWLQFQQQEMMRQRFAR
jgi:hypothetical protein